MGNRHDEIRSHGIREVVVFHSTAKELAKHEAEMPFPLIPDPERALYRQLGVERGPSSLLSRGALRAAMSGEAAAIRNRITTRGVLGPVKPHWSAPWAACRPPDRSRRSERDA